MTKEDRTGFLGGSDTLRIMDGDWHGLWMEKMGYKEPEDLSDVLAVQLGIWTEPFHVKLFEKDKQVEVQQQVKYHYMWNGVPCRGVLDGEFKIYEERFGLECKHTNESTNMNKQLERYMPQLQFYMKVSGINSIYFSNIFGNRRYEYVKVNKDEQFLERMFVHLKEFWQHVEDEKEPPLGMPHITAGIDQIAINDMVARDASTDNSFHYHTIEYLETKDAAKVNADALKTLKQMVSADEREVYNDQISIRRDKRGSLRVYTK
jgi:predicted phage-related endonuclease